MSKQLESKEMFHFIHPFSALVAGPSGCGKSYFIAKFIKYISVVCNTAFEKIIWFYDEWQPLYENLKKYNVEFIRGLPEIDFDGSVPVLIIIDDLMSEADQRIVDIFTKGSHHRNISVLFVTQNLFHQGKGRRDISLNAHYIIYFKNPRDRAQIKHLALQVYPENSQFVYEAYKDATSQPHGYIFIDLKQITNDDYRFRTNIFPDDQYCYAYVPKTKKYK